MMVTNTRKEMESLTTKYSGGGSPGDDFLLFMELRKKIMTFRDLFDIPPLNASVPLHEPEFVPRLPTEKLKERNTHQALICFYEILKCIGDSSSIDDTKIKDKFKHGNVEKVSLDELAAIMVTLLECMNRAGKERFEAIEEDERLPIDQSPKSEEYDSNSPTSVLPETPNFEYRGYSPSRLWNLRAQAVEKLSPVGWTPLSFHLLLRNNMQHKRDQKRFEGEEPKENVEVTKTCETRVKGSRIVIEEESCLDSNDAKMVYHFPLQQGQVQLQATIPPSPSPSLPPSHPQSMNESSLPTFPPPLSPHPQKTIESLSLLPTLPPIKTMHVQSSPLPPPQSCVSPSPPSTTAPQQVQLDARLPPPSSKALPSTPTDLKDGPSPMPMGKGGGPPTPPLLSPPNTTTLQQVKLGAEPPPPLGAGLGPPPPPPGRAPPPNGLKGGPPAPPPPMSMGKGGGPPPPPGALRPLNKKPVTNLKRSPNMGRLYIALKRKMDGSTNLTAKSSEGKKFGGGGGGGGKEEGMAAALAEMTKSSRHYLQMEEDIEKYGKSIKETQAALNTFKTKDMDELFKFHNKVESTLGLLSDENQILKRFEGFPLKKLEAVRMGGSTINKLNGHITSLQNWKFESPLEDHLPRVENHFTKIKKVVETIEKNKKNDGEMLESQNIHFDFNILLKVKEALVDFSSRCMEFAIKERSALKAVSSDQMAGKIARQRPMLWRVFQFTHKVYICAEGLNERAENFIKELALEIEFDPFAQK